MSRSACTRRPCRGGGRLHGPRASPASTTQLERKIVTIEFAAGSRSEMEVEMLARHLRAGLTDDMWVATSDLFEDTTAVLLEAASSAALSRGYDGAKIMAALSTRTALLIPARDEHEWRRLLDASLGGAEEDWMFVVRRRRSAGGRAWATPTATMQQLQAMRSKPRTANPAAVSTMLQLHGQLGFHSEGIVEAIMGIVRTTLGHEMKELQPGNTTEMDSWKVMLKRARSD